MRNMLLVVLVTAFAAACGGSSKPDTTEPTTTGDPPPAEAPDVVTPEECEANGGVVAWDIGDGSVQCPAGTEQTSNVSGGVEPGLCCQPAAADPGAPAE